MEEEEPPSTATAVAAEWVVLHRYPTSRKDDDDDGIFLSLAAPPRISLLAVPPAARGSRVLAADPSGILLISIFSGADHPSYLIWDALHTNTTHYISSSTETPSSSCAGLLVLPARFSHNHTMLAELSFAAPPPPSLAATPTPHKIPIGSTRFYTPLSSSVSRGILRLVVMTTTRMPKIKLWTLADHEAAKWTLDFDVSISGFQTDAKLAFVHPTNPHVVYFFLKHQLTAVDLQTMNTIGTEDHDPSSSLVHMDKEVPESASNFTLLPWALPPSLRTTLSGPSLAQDTENKFKLSERLFMQIFLEQTDTKEKKYAHLNFYGATDSERTLVFAEFHTDAVCDNEPNQWALSACKTLKMNYHGGLYGEDADQRRSMGSKKRKKSIYCFACTAELLHPISGFHGGYAGMSAM
uniref:DUF1618 domain-containing protein n=1 Tax=Leersia perrieri TaxID=77586 RepID=A0A0D9VND2_9ORYZ